MAIQDYELPQKAVFACVPWQRCSFDIQQNALVTIPRDAMKAEGTRDISAIPNAGKMYYALEGIKVNVAKVKSIAPKRSAWLETALAESLTVMELPGVLRYRLRTSNGTYAHPPGTRRTVGLWLVRK